MYNSSHTADLSSSMSSSSLSSALMSEKSFTSAATETSSDSIVGAFGENPNLSIGSVLKSVSNNIVVSLFADGHYEQVVSITSELLNEGISSFLLKARGESYSKLNLHQKAIRDLDKALGLDPDCFRTHNNIALAYKEIGLLSAASEHLEFAIKLNSGFPEAYSNYGNVLAEQANMTKARSSYLKSIKLEPENPAALWNLHSTCHDIDSAKEVLERCLEMDAGYEPAVYSLATINALKGNTKFLDWILNTEVGSESTLRSIAWILSLPNIPRLEFNRWRVFDFAIERSIKDRAFYEFGVWMGQSFRYLEPHFAASFGFDTFEGLPEDWHEIPSGTYSSFGKIPKIAKAQFIVGEFSESLPKFFQSKRPVAGLLNFDADLYSSTASALTHSRSVTDHESILVFDEMIINENWEHDEYRALQEYCKNFNLSYEVLCVSLFTKQVVLRLHEAKTEKRLVML